MAKKKKIKVDGGAFDSVEAFHEYMRRVLVELDYKGNDLKALENALLLADEPVRLIIENKEAMIETLGDYAKRFDVLLHEAATANPNFTFKYK